MKASIVIPAFNEEKYIQRTLEALLAQDYHDFEIIVVDNNSTDKTSEVARATGVTVIHEGKKGTMNACEAGRRIATGDIIIRVDADCIPDTDYIRKGLEHFKNEKIVGVSGPYYYYDGTFFFRNFSLFFQKYIYRLTNDILQLIGTGAIFIGGNSFMRATTLEQIDGFSTSIIFYGDDTDTAKRMSKHGKIIFDPDISVKSSARRFKAEGNLKITFLYLKGFLQFTFFRPKKK